MTDLPPHRPVVVGVDASDAALRAVRFAADEAIRRAVPLHVVHATSWPFGGLASPPPEEEMAELVRSAAEQVIRTAVEAATAGGSLEVTASVLDGAPVPVLQEASADASLLVVGSRGAGGVAGLLVGSTATGVVHHAQCPVVVLPDPTAAAVQGRRSVVVGVEGRPGEEDLLAFAFDEAVLRGTDLVAVHAWREVAGEVADPALSPLVDWAGVLSDEQRALSEALAGWREKAPDVVVREVVVRDRPVRPLLGVGLTAELLVVGHRGRHWLSPTTHAVLHRAPCPLAIVPLRPAGAR
ncbi:universal stress protein [Blastococcus sp. TF02A-30]|uniref:universal stress protein n=1 Tax=Blastococcus sp. TF02A-30 TaxID=2250580 RepID=UPI000DEBBDF2|nr:universal stress protein [Blastococcus sp. TF02A-30]RBY87742.1 universal stress protein [Blastococcus sp. TF02A-30]